MKNILKKQEDSAFGKKVYFLGKDKDGIKYWLQEPRWDCNWYWGFGYIETYSGNRLPSKARDISSHQHATNFMSEFFTEWNGSEPILEKRTFDEKEGWELSELFKEFYFLRDSAERWARGNCHVSGEGMIPKKPKLVERINGEIIPRITARIIEILKPKQ